MKKTEIKDENIALRAVTELGAASEETKGIPDALSVESFQSRPFTEELSAD